MMKLAASVIVLLGVVSGCGAGSTASGPSGSTDVQGKVDGAPASLAQAYYGVVRYDDGKLVTTSPVRIILLSASTACPSSEAVAGLTVHLRIAVERDYIGNVNANMTFDLFGNLVLPGNLSDDVLRQSPDLHGSVDADARPIGGADPTVKGHIAGSFNAKHCPSLDSVMSAASP